VYFTDPIRNKTTALEFFFTQKQWHILGRGNGLLELLRGGRGTKTVKNSCIILNTLV